MAVTTTETALDWYRRSQRKRAAAQSPADPCSAAAAFVRGASGFAPLDAAWRIPPSSNHSINNAKSNNGSNYPVVILEGRIGKTWTLLSLAARFVVLTRASRFDTDEATEEPESPSDDGVSSATMPSTKNNSSSTPNDQPQVILLDSSWDMTISKLAYMVRSTLLRATSGGNGFDVTEETLESEVEGCLRRIHLATVDEMQDAWVPILECLRCKLKEDTKCPTLLLWDGFYADSKQPEVRWQVLRLLQDCSVAMVATGSSGSVNGSSWRSDNNNNHPHNNGRNRSPMGNRAYFEWLRDNQARDLHRIQLEQRSGKDCFAIFNGSKLPFSISLGGVLS